MILLYKIFLSGRHPLLTLPGDHHWAPVKTDQVDRDTNQLVCNYELFSSPDTFYAQQAFHKLIAWYNDKRFIIVSLFPVSPTGPNPNRRWLCGKWFISSWRVILSFIWWKLRFNITPFELVDRFRGSKPRVNWDQQSDQNLILAATKWTHHTPDIDIHSHFKWNFNGDIFISNKNVLNLLKFNFSAHIFPF